jgi:hypothetical protein
MFAVIRHTYKLVIPDPSNLYSTKSSAKWEHLVWIFATELDAITFAITLLDDPLITGNDWLLQSAITNLEKIDSTKWEERVLLLQKYKMLHKSSIKMILNKQ